METSLRISYYRRRVQVQLAKMEVPSMTTKRDITVTVNGQKYQSTVEPRMLLVHYLREMLDLTGTHIGCNTSQCGACVVMLNDEAVKSCTLLAVQADQSPGAKGVRFPPLSAKRSHAAAR